jgi:hypothetical protein
MADVVAVEAAEEAELAEGSPVMSPGPEVVDVSDLPEGTPIAELIPDAPIVIDADTDDECDDEVTSKVTPTSAMNATVSEKMNASASSDAEETGYKSDDDEAPVSARRTPGRRSRAIVDSDDSDDNDAKVSVKASEEEGSGESPAVGTPPAATTPPARPAFNLAPPTTGKKSILRRIASNRKMRAEREEQEHEATMRAPNFDDAAEAGQPSERSAAAGRPRAPRVDAAQGVSQIRAQKVLEVRRGPGFRARALRGVRHVHRDHPGRWTTQAPTQGCHGVREEEGVGVDRR